MSTAHAQDGQTKETVLIPSGNMQWPQSAQNPVACVVMMVRPKSSYCLNLTSYCFESLKYVTSYCLQMKLR